MLYDKGNPVLLEPFDIIHVVEIYNESRVTRYSIIGTHRSQRK
jgi:hypothetical protein